MAHKNAPPALAVASAASGSAKQPLPDSHGLSRHSAGDNGAEIPLHLCSPLLRPQPVTVLASRSFARRSFTEAFSASRFPASESARTWAATMTHRIERT